MTYTTPKGKFDSIKEGAEASDMSEYDFLIKCRRGIDGYGQVTNQQEEFKNLSYYSDVIGSNKVDHSLLSGSGKIYCTESQSSDSDIIKEFKKHLDKR